MNLLKVLLTTYDQALSCGVVDNSDNMKEPNLLPLYHSNKKSATGKDIFVITLNEEGRLIKGSYLEQNEYIVFPVTEESINRTTNAAPHPICDEVSYLVSDGTKKGIEKNKLYFEVQEDIKTFLEQHNKQNIAFQAIYRYVRGNTLLEDIANNITKGEAYTLDGSAVIYEEAGKQTKVDLAKLFITFEIAYADKGIITVSQDKELHQLYIEYVTAQNEAQPEQEYCDISGKKMYCISTHRGLVGKAKLISISNHKDTYFGRFTDGEQIIHIGYETSQKIHNMLKFLLDSDKYKHYLGENSYCVSWLSYDLLAAQAPLYEDQEVRQSDEGYSSDETQVDETENDDTSAEPMKHEDVLLGYIVPALTRYFAGVSEREVTEADDFFCVLIIEKSSNGRMSVKYFQSFAISDIKERAQQWYIDLAWPHWDVENQTRIMQAPSLRKLINYTYGEEGDKGIICQQKKVVRKNLERLLPCVLTGKPLPIDFYQTAVNRLKNRESYDKFWDAALNRCCSIIKKHKADKGYQVFDEKGALRMENSRSFLYGRLLATYEKLEMDAMSSNSKSEGRITNAERLWSAMQSRPLQISVLLQRKSMPYQNSLKKRKMGLYVNYDKLLTELYTAIKATEENTLVARAVLKEDFILGYYAQKQSFYTKKDKTEVKLETEE
ncbi:type I-C CRISPR-associated protein Cas8c/Csd1 [Veillonella intestinalis]|uniref:type I-C CRISPR-associated protein Cas8c/Csd1 n=1 Tax=Veillonella intestinalis TaxID=2941341 RepID=UPI00203EF871|nr:type I-C CRISPR-associated protein Cas8c/Csd1 [Veillonella intestinalis]